MKRLIVNELYSCYKKRNAYILVLLFLNIFLQIYILIDAKNIGKVDATSTDGILKVCGGIDKIFYLPNLFQWILLIGILLLLVQSSTSIIGGFDVFLLTRAGSKLRWWTAKVLSLILLTFIFTILLMVITKILSHIAFPAFNKWSQYTYLYYPKIFASSINTHKMEFIIFCVLLTGFIAITTLFQTINLIFNKYANSYVVILILCIMLGVLCMQGIIPRALSPINYPSTIDIAPNIGSYLKSIGMNIVLSLINIAISLIFVTHSDYTVSKN
ncbi:hypothetical protein E4V42_07905 [Clostridium estertheticum]|uniref:Uncharacterized protein n=1 Tax=Clostridium estertheticum TaxID=238834 RepID=A0A5N7IM14_9CLOT|nr:hypothetical protein [Clostridium estertheticum]MPQ31359.1 hypothetical protein [Clostridium estertheticum]MPQ62033.1 hypothetical protein [Clostridium estertheticum]